MVPPLEAKVPQLLYLHQGLLSRISKVHCRLHCAGHILGRCVPYMQVVAHVLLHRSLACWTESERKYITSAG